MVNLGNYTCEVEWAGMPMSVSHTLVVLQPPRISKPVTGEKTSVRLLVIMFMIHLQVSSIMPVRENPSVSRAKQMPILIPMSGGVRWRTDHCRE